MDFWEYHEYPLNRDEPFVCTVLNVDGVGLEDLKAEFQWHCKINLLME